MDIVPANYVGAGIVAVHMQDKPEHGAYNLSTGVGLADLPRRSSTRMRKRRPSARATCSRPRSMPAFDKLVDRLMDTPRKLGRGAGRLADEGVPAVPHLRHRVRQHAHPEGARRTRPRRFTDYCYGLFKFATEGNFKYPYKPWPEDVAAVVAGRSPRRPARTRTLEA